MARTKSLNKNKDNEKAIDGASTNVQNQMSVLEETKAGARDIKRLESISPLYSSSQIKKSANAFGQVLTKNASKFTKNSKKVANNEMVSPIKDIDTGLYISESASKKQITEYLKYKEWTKRNQPWTKEIPKIPNIKKINILKCWTSDSKFIEFYQKVLTHDKYMLILKEQRQIARMALKQHNKQFANKYDHIELKNFKINLSDLFDKLPNLDEKFTDTKNELLSFEWEFEKAMRESKVRFEKPQKIKASSLATDQNTQVLQRDPTNGSDEEKELINPNKLENPEKRYAKEKFKKRVKKAHKKIEVCNQIERDTHYQKIKQNVKEKGRSTEIITGNQEKHKNNRDSSESIERINDLIEVEEEIKGNNLTNNENTSPPKLLIANYYFSDWDDTAFKQYNDSKDIKDINKDINDNLSEPNSTPERLFADQNKCKYKEFNENQNDILNSEEVSRNEPLKQALIKWFKYIWNRVKILVKNKSKQDENRKEESKELNHSPDKPENQQRNPSQKQKCTSSKQKRRNWSTINKNNVRGECKKIASWIFNKLEHDYKSLIALQTKYIQKRKLTRNDQGDYHFNNFKK